MQLRDLNLEDNQLKSVPREVGWIGKSLRSLLLARNKIVRLPGEVAFLNPSIKISLDGNPLVVSFTKCYFPFLSKRFILLVLGSF